MRPEWISLALRVNGIEFHRGYLRRRDEERKEFEVVVEDRRLGSFSLHDGFVLEIRAAEKVWRPVSLEELKTAFWEAAQTGGCWSAETGEQTPRSSGEELREHVATTIPRIPVERDTGYIDRAREALSQARIRFRFLGGVDSRGRCWGHVTLAVHSLLGARIHLRRAGFLESPEAKHLLIDSQSGWKIQLLEDRN